ncbi:MAG: TolC family protein [Gemmatimonadota bacterium]
MGRWIALSVIVLGMPAAVAAQDSTTTNAPPVPAATLTLAEALDQARGNSPTYRQTLNDAGPAKWGVRNAYGSFLPQVSVNGGVGYTGSGQSNFGGGFIRATSPIITSNYGLNLNWQLDGAVLSGPGQAKANQRAAQEDITGAGSALKFDVTQQYLISLQASAQVAVNRQQVQRQEDFLKLAQAKYQVGQSTLIDVRQAEVQLGQAQVALLRSIQTDNEAKLELFRRMGVVPPVMVDQIALTDSFPVTEPSFDLPQLLSLASEQNPALRAVQAREDAAAWTLRAAKSAYLPTLSVQAGWSGFSQRVTDEQSLISNAFTGALSSAAQCDLDNQIRAGLTTPLPPLNCDTAFIDPTRTQLDPALSSSILSSNNVGLFDFQKQPFRVNLTLSVPLFTGFGRTLRVSQARANQEDLNENVRARGLQVRTEVESRYLAIGTSYRAIVVQQANREAARDQLRLAQDRYRLGSGTSLELSTAQNDVVRAEGDYINAVYDYHKAIAALEAAVGRPLR